MTTQDEGRSAPDLLTQGSDGPVDVEDLRHDLRRRGEDCERTKGALLPILREHPLSRDDVKVERPRAGYVAEVAADVLRWYAEEVSRLREQLAAQPTLPQDAETQIARAIHGYWDLMHGASGEDYDETAAGQAHQVMKVLRSWGVSSSEVEAPQEMVQHKVLIYPGDPNLWTAYCQAPKCGQWSGGGTQQHAEDWKDQHEADTLRPVADEGRPSGSERLAPRPVEARVKTATPEEFDSTYKGHGGQCTSTNGTPEYRCEWMVGHEGDHRRYVGPYRWELWQDAAQAARSEATPRLRECVERWPDCEEGAFNPSCCRFPKSCSCTIYDPAAVKPEDLESLSPSLRKEGEDSV